MDTMVRVGNYRTLVRTRGTAILFASCMQNDMVILSIGHQIDAQANITLSCGLKLLTKRE